jgi:hypothetical protein
MFCLLRSYMKTMIDVNLFFFGMGRFYFYHIRRVVAESLIIDYSPQFLMFCRQTTATGRMSMTSSAVSE